MFEIHGVPPADSQERKLTTRWTQESAVEYAHNLASFGYKNLRVTETKPEAPTPEVDPPEEA